MTLMSHVTAEWNVASAKASTFGRLYVDQGLGFADAPVTFGSS